MNREPEFNRFFADNAENKRYDYNLNEQSIVIDVGAYKGTFAENIIKIYGCEVHAYEPIPSYQSIIENLNLRNCHVYKYGLSDEDKIVSMNLMDDGTSQYINRNAEIIQCQMKSISNELNRFDTIDLLKLNVEGDEFPILEKIINDDVLINKIKNIQVQFHNFIDGCYEKYDKIYNGLSKTHNLDWRYYFVWENWSIK